MNIKSAKQWAYSGCSFRRSTTEDVIQWTALRRRWLCTVTSTLHWMWRCTH